MSSFCELCGRQVTDGQKKVMIDSTVFNVCTSCSKRGKPYMPSETAKKKTMGYTAAKTMGYTAPKRMIRPFRKISMTDDIILNPEFAKIIREARMKKGLTHEQLGIKMNEKATILRKFETGTLKPDEILAKKLEHFLGIKLHINIEEME
jgi:putative transcription factor